jgi:hypothetical protein
MLTDFGLWGTDVRRLIEEAKIAAIAGDEAKATQLAGTAIREINNGAANGSLRLAGIIFLGVAIVGVLGLWIMLRRQAGPKWARSSTPHWVDKDRGGLFKRKPKPPKPPKSKSSKSSQQPPQPQQPQLPQQRR